MTGLALALVLLAAIAHATWNLVAKRAGGGAVFVWLYAAFSAVIWAPLTLNSFLRNRHSLSRVDLIIVLVSGLIHTVYFLVLQKAYRVGDLSVVYPVARGTGPALTTLGAIVLLGEHPTRLALLGTALIICAIFVFSKPIPVPGAKSGLAVRLGLLTGIFIAFYSLWDKQAVAEHRIPTLIIEWSTSATRVLLLLPVVLRNRDELAMDWSSRRWPAIWIAVLNPLAYLFVLVAMKFTPISYVAPAREISILFGALFGGHVLRESDRGRRLVGACLMLMGIICLSLP